MTVPMAGPGPGMWTSTIPALNLTTFENIFFKRTTWASYARQSHRSIGSRTGFSGLAGWACSCRRPQRRDPQLDCAMTSLTTSQRISRRHREALSMMAIGKIDFRRTSQLAVRAQRRRGRCAGLGPDRRSHRPSSLVDKRALSFVDRVGHFSTPSPRRHSGRPAPWCCPR
jgi:hypothetical protein